MVFQSDVMLGAHLGCNQYYASQRPTQFLEIQNDKTHYNFANLYHHDSLPKEYTPLFFLQMSKSKVKVGKKKINIGGGAEVLALF